MSEIHTARFYSAAAGLRILTNFVFVSVILSEWRDRQRSPRCLISPRWVPASSSNHLRRGSTSRHWPALTSPRCRIRRRWMKAAPTRRTTTPRTKRSWPPPPATSGPPCRTWKRSWTWTSRTFPSRATSRPLWMRTVFPLRLQVRLRRLNSSRNSNPVFANRLGSSSIGIDFCGGMRTAALSQFPTALWPREQPSLHRGCVEKKPNLIWVTHELTNTPAQRQLPILFYLLVSV